MTAAIVFPLACLLMALTRPAKLGPWEPADLVIVALGGAFATCGAWFAVALVEASR